MCLQGVELSRNLSKLVDQPIDGVEQIVKLLCYIY